MFYNCFPHSIHFSLILFLLSDMQIASREHQEVLIASLRFIFFRNGTAINLLSNFLTFKKRRNYEKKRDGSKKFNWCSLVIQNYLVDPFVDNISRFSFDSYVVNAIQIAN